VRDKYNLELKASSYNILNHQNITSVNSAAYTVSNIGGVNTLTAISGANSFSSVANSNNNNIYVPRQIQFEARFTF